MIKRFFISCLVLPVIGILLQLCNLLFWHVSSAFIPQKFNHGFHHSYSTSVSGLDVSILNPILAQEFHYLGHGKQMIAFESTDGRFVLKLFYPMRPLKNRWYTHWKYWEEYFSFKWIFREQFQKKTRLKKIFLRHKYAFEKLSKETGILFAHLCPSKFVSHTVKIIDQTGKTHYLSLSNVPFIIQEKAILVPEYFTSLFKQNAIREIKEAIESLEKLLARRVEEGITDRIQTMWNNYGFVGNKPIQIDVGRIHFDKNLIDAPEKELTRVLNNFHTWLYMEFPNLKKI